MTGQVTLAQSVAVARDASERLDSPLLRAIDEGKRVRVRARGIPDVPAPMLASEGFPYWSRALTWRSEHQYDSVVLITGATGCHDRNGKVLMFDGTIRNITEVKVDDILMGPDSQPRIVLRLWRGRSPMRRIVPSQGMTPFVVTSNYSLVMKRNRRIGKPKKTQATEVVEIEVDRLPSSNYRRHNSYHLFGSGVDFTDDSSLPLDPYLLGVFLGDGSLTKGYGSTITTNDPEIEAFITQWSVEHGLKVTRNSKKGTSAVSLRVVMGSARPLSVSEFGRQNSMKTNGPEYYRTREKFVAAGHSVNRAGGQRNPLKDILRGLGLYPIACDERFIPHGYLTSSRANRLSLLAGLLDTDGSISPSGDGSYVSKSERLANDVVFLARSLGLPASVSVQMKGCQTGAVGKYFGVHIRGDLSTVPMCVTRKRARSIRHCGSRWKEPWRHSFTVENLPEDDYFGVEVDKDHRYLTGDFVVFRNSGKSTLALRLAQSIDPTFTLQTRLCYTAAELLAIYETIEAGQVCLFDEGVRALLAGDQMSVEQKALVQALALVREKGAILFICAPSIWNIAKQVRQNRAWMWIHVLGRGLGLVHERNDYLRYIPDATLGFSRSDRCPYLTWTAYAKNSAFFKTYRVVKTEHLNAYLKETKELLESKNRPKGSKLDKKLSAEIDSRLKAGEPWNAIAKDIQARGMGPAAAPAASAVPSASAKVAVAAASAGGAMQSLFPTEEGPEVSDDKIEEALRTMPVYKIRPLLHVGSERIQRVKKSRCVPDFQQPL